MNDDKNLIAFSKFRDSVKNKKQLSNGDESLLATITYKWNGQEINETLELTLRLTTYEYGRINIDDGELLNSNNVHMEFNSDFQEYQFIENSKLRIIGRNSPKIGNYEVTIAEKE